MSWVPASPTAGTRFGFSRDPRFPIAAPGCGKPGGRSPRPIAGSPFRGRFPDLPGFEYSS
jgi:hypothetical protein